MSFNVSNFNENYIAKVNYKIIGFGNIYMSDDGIGIKIIDELRKSNFLKNYKNTELIDGGTSAIDLIFIIQESQYNKIIIIDAVDAGQNIGEIVKFKLNDIYEFSGKDFRSFSLHDLNLAEIFNLIKSLNIKSDITIIGIKPKIIKYGEELSPEIKEKIPEIILKIKEELTK
ncbi:MAG: hydrogenase maturation protease [Actinobacteria bacterium]|nr:hydrogenase maturation protease [Actinomycetota bacterium]